MLGTITHAVHRQGDRHGGTSQPEKLPAVAESTEDEEELNINNNNKSLRDNNIIIILWYSLPITARSRLEKQWLRCRKSIRESLLLYLSPANDRCQRVSVCHHSSVWMLLMFFLGCFLCLQSFAVGVSRSTTEKIHFRVRSRKPGHFISLQLECSRK